MNLFNPHFKKARARSRIYLLLAEFFRSPSSHPEEKSALNSLFSYTKTLCANSPAPDASIVGFREVISESLLARRRESAEDLSARYENFFGCKEPITLDESPYRQALSAERSEASGREEQSEERAAEDAGLHGSPGLVLAQLEFMHCLAEAESEYIMEELEQAVSACRRRQVSFLRGNVRTCLPRLSRTLSESSDSDFLKLLVTATDMFTEMDARDLSLSLRNKTGEAGYNASLPGGDMQAVSLRVDGSSCSLCGVCIRSCPNAALTLDTKEGALKLRHFRPRCDNCEACVRSCPEAAMTLAAGAGESQDVGVLIAREMSLCTRCGRLNESAPILDAVVERLGKDFSPNLLDKLSLCEKCRRSRLKRSTTRAEPTLADRNDTVNSSFAAQNEVLQV